MNIVDSIRNYLNRYMVFVSEDQATICALWVLHTWTFSDSFPKSPMTTPYLYVTSAGPQSGKTQLIDLLEPICLNSERTIDMTSSVMFRLIEAVHPTLFVDEVDTVFDGPKNNPLRGVLNGGYKHSGYVWRVAPGEDGVEPTKFRTFSAKLLAGIDNGQLPDTIATRCIEIMLEKVGKLDEDTGELVAPDGSRRELYYSFMAEELAEHLVSEVEAFMATWKANYVPYMPKPIPGIAPRQFEIAFPLLQVAHAAGIEDEAREAIKRVFLTRKKRDTPEQAVLRQVRDVFTKLDAERLHAATIVEEMGDGWNTKLLASRLKGQIKGTSQNIKINGYPSKGYYRHQFVDAWDQLP